MRTLRPLSCLWTGICVVLFAGTSAAQLYTGANQSVSPQDGRYRNEPSIVWPNGLYRKLVASSNQNAVGEFGGFVSTDAGTNWTDAPVTDVDCMADPALDSDSVGNAYLFYMRFECVGLGGRNALLVRRHASNGTAWEGPWTAITHYNEQNISIFEDKPAFAIDSVSVSRRDFLFATWTRFTQNFLGFWGADSIRFSYADSGSSTTLNNWTNAFQISDGSDVQGSTVKIGPNGQVYAAWKDGGGILFGDSIRFKVITPGQTIGTDVTISSINAIGRLNGIPTRRSHSFPWMDVDRSGSQYRGSIYLVWAEVNGNNGADVFLSRSTDGGANWSAKTRINDDSTAGDQFYPIVAVDQSNGDVYVAYYDRRLDPNNLQVDVFLSRSTDGGQTFASAIRVTDVSSDPRCADTDNGLGDYIGLVARDGVVFPIWTDTRNSSGCGTSSPISRVEIFSSQLVFRPATVNWQMQTLPSAVNSGQAIQFGWVVEGGGFVQHTHVHFGTNPDPRTNATYFEPPSGFSGGMGAFSHTIVMPTVSTPTTFYFAAHAQTRGGDSYSIAILSTVVMPPAQQQLTATWQTQPPSTTNSGSTFTVVWSVSGASTVTHTNVHYGPTTDPINFFSGTTPAQSGGAGTYSATVIAPVVSTATQYCFVVHAQAGTAGTHSNVVCSTVSPANTQAQVSLGTVFPVTSDLKSEQYAHQACSSSLCIVAYEYFFSSSNHDVYYKGVNPSTGQVVLGPTAVAISSLNEAVSHVGFNGSRFLILFTERRSASEAWLRGALLDSSGNPLFSITIDNTLELNLFGDVAASGSTFIVVYQKKVPNFSDYDIYVRTVSSTGTVSPARALAQTLLDEKYPYVAVAGNRALVVYEELSGTTHRVKAILTDTTGAPVGSPFDIDFGSSAEIRPTVSSDGSRFLVVYDWPLSATDHDIWGAIVSTTGSIVAGPFRIDGATNDDKFPRLAFGSNNFLLVFQRELAPSTHEVRGYVLDSNGSLASPRLDITNSLVESFEPSVGFGGGNFLAAWHDNQTPTSAFDVRARTVTVTPPNQDFSIDIQADTVSLLVNQSTAVPVRVDSINGFNTSVSLTVSGCPSNTTCSIQSAVVPPATPALNLATTSTTPGGTYTISLTGTGGGKTHSDSMVLVVPQADFSVQISPNSGTVVAGQSLDFTVSVSAINNMSTPVSLSASGCPPSSCNFLQNLISPGASTTLRVQTATTSEGFYSIQVTGTALGLQHSSVGQLIVTAPPDFLFSVTPTSLSLVQGQTAQLVLALSAQNGFSGTVQLSCSGLPPGALCTFNPTSVNLSSSMLQATSLVNIDTTNIQSGTYTVVFMGSASGGVSHQSSAVLVVNAAPAVSSLTLNPTSIVGGQSATATVVLTTVAPSGGVVVSITANSQIVQFAPTVTVSVGNISADFTITSSSVATQTSVIFTAAFGSSSKQATLSITPATDVTPPVIGSVVSSNLTSSGATINWTTDEASDSQVEYGTTAAYGSSTPLNTSLVTNHSVALSGLQASTLYHYRVKSRDAAGNLATSGDFTFTTAALAATRTLTVNSTNPSSGVQILVSPNDINGQANGPTPLTRVYNNGTSVALTASNPAPNGNAFGSWTNCPNAIQNVCTAVLNADTVITANYVPPPPPPSVSTTAATGVTQNSATLNGTVNPNGTPLDAWFRWGTDSTLTTFNETARVQLPGDNTDHAVATPISGLSPSTTYFFRLVAFNGVATVQGTILSFTTGVPPLLTLTVASSNPTSGVQINATPADTTSKTGGVTQFTLTYAQGTGVTLTAPPTAPNGNNFSAWSGCDNASGTSCTVAMNFSRTVTADYVTPAGPVASLSTTNVTFANQIVNTTSASQNVVLSNTGNAALNINSIAVGGTNGAEFNQTNTCGTTVAAGASCTVTVTFQPTATGSRNAALTITDNAPGSPRTVTLSGTGVDFSISPGPGSTTTATISAGQTATFTLNVAGTAGFQGTATFSCAFSAPAPTASTCMVSPTSGTLNGTSPLTITVTVTTTARSFVVPPSWPRLLPPMSVPVLQLELMLLLLLLALSLACAKRRMALVRFAPAVAVFFLVVLIAGCGGGGSASPPSPPPRQGTQPGTYTLNVSATTGGVSRSIPLTLNVT